MSTGTAVRAEEALSFMGLDEGQPIAGTKIDVAFVGSCTNARLSDLREAARVVRGRHVAAARQGPGRPRVTGGARRGRARGSRSGVLRSRIRMARRRVLDVPGDEH